MSQLARKIRSDLATAADPSRAQGMQAYMKSAMPYRGVRMPEVRAICKRAFDERPLASCEAWQIRKAIGWALRAYAWTDPDAVSRYVRAHEGQLSGLSRREAIKNIG